MQNITSAKNVPFAMYVDEMCCQIVFDRSYVFLFYQSKRSWKSQNNKCRLTLLHIIRSHSKLMSCFHRPILTKISIFIFLLISILQFDAFRGMGCSIKKCIHPMEIWEKSFTGRVRIIIKKPYPFGNCRKKILTGEVWISNRLVLKHKIFMPFYDINVQ